MAHYFPGYHWIYWLGPALGSFLAAFFYHLLETFGWQTANPGQDYSDLEAQTPVISEKTPQPSSRDSDSDEAQMTTNTQV